MEEAIRFYYGKNFKYKLILECLEKYHNIKICKRTLITKLQEYGLQRRRYNANDEQARALLKGSYVKMATSWVIERCGGNCNLSMEYVCAG